MNIVTRLWTAFLGLFGLGKETSEITNMNSANEINDSIIRRTNDGKIVLNRIFAAGAKKVYFRSRKTGRILTAKILRRYSGEFLVQRNSQSFYVTWDETVTVPEHVPGTFKELSVVG